VNKAISTTKSRVWAAVRNTVLVLSALSLLVGLMLGRATWEGRSNLRAADTAIRAKDNRIAIVHARAAASWYFPKAAHVAGGYARLIHIARLSEAMRDRDTALVAWRGVRSAAMGSRWLVQPHQKELNLANASLARLASEVRPTMLAPEQSPSVLEQKYRNQLSEQSQTRTWWVVVLMAGLFLFAVAGPLSVLRLTPTAKVWAWSKARWPMAGAACGLVTFLVAVLMA
jgi:hypothetical protein